MSAPWFKFYPSDWRADPALRMCSLGARGLWMELLCVMHEATPRGFLLINGRPLTATQMAGLVGCGVEDASSYLGELTEAGVLSRDETGLIYSRRMRADTERAAKDRANGGKGGNPFLKGGVNPPDNPLDNPPDNGRDKAQKPEARQYSVSKDTGVAAAELPSAPALADPRTMLFRDGVSAVRGLTGKSDPAARTLVGRWLKTARDDCRRLLRVIEDAQDAKPADPVAWIEAALQQRHGQPKSGTAFLAARG